MDGRRIDGAPCFEYKFEKIIGDRVMRLAEMRSKVAPLLGTSDDNLRIRQQELYKQPQLRNVRPGRRAAGSDTEGLRATAASSALVLLTAVLGYSKDKIGRAVVRFWEAPVVTRTGNPLEECKISGALLTLLLERADIRGELAYFEIDHDIPHIAFVFNLGSRLVYAPYKPREWERRVKEAEKQGEVAHLTRLPVATLHKVADLIADESARPARRWPTPARSQ
jgi:hypothetical protein